MKWWTNRKKRRLTETLEFAAEGLETRRMLATFAVNGTDFTTIQSAVDAAAANPGADTVLISSGTYAENVLVQDAGPVTLLGDTNAVTIQGGVGNAVTIQNGGDVVLQRLNLTGSLNGIQASNTGSLRVNNVTADGNASRGMIVDTVGEVRVGNSRFRNNANDGILLQDAANSTLIDVVANANGNDGLDVARVAALSSSVYVLRGTYSQNGDDGLELQADSVRVAYARASLNAEDGVQVSDASSLNLFRSTFDDNIQEGVDIDVVDSITMQGTFVRRSGNLGLGDGVNVRNAGSVVIIGGRFDNSAQNGLDFAQVNSIDLTGALARNNGQNGLSAVNVSQINVLRGQYTANVADGLDIAGLATNNVDSISLSRVRAANNGANGVEINFADVVTIGNGRYLTNGTNGIKIFNAVATTLANAWSKFNVQDGLRVVGSTLVAGPAATVTVIDGVYAYNVEDGIDLESVATVIMNGVRGFQNQDDGLQVVGATFVDLGTSRFFNNLNNNVVII